MEFESLESELVGDDKATTWARVLRWRTRGMPRGDGARVLVLFGEWLPTARIPMGRGSWGKVVLTSAAVEHIGIACGEGGGGVIRLAMAWWFCRGSDEGGVSIG